MDQDFASVRPVRVSQVTMTELMIPAYANFGGKIHGGILRSPMDKLSPKILPGHKLNHT